MPHAPRPTSTIPPALASLPPRSSALTPSSGSYYGPSKPQQASPLEDACAAGFTPSYTYSCRTYEGCLLDAQCVPQTYGSSEPQTSQFCQFLAKDACGAQPDCIFVPTALVGANTNSRCEAAYMAAALGGAGVVKDPVRLCYYVGACQQACLDRPAGAYASGTLHRMLPALAPSCLRATPHGQQHADPACARQQPLTRCTPSQPPPLPNINRHSARVRGLRGLPKGSGSNQAHHQHHWRQAG